MNDLYLENEIEYLKERYSILSQRFCEETCRFEKEFLRDRLLEIEAQLKKLGVYI